MAVTLVSWIGRSCPVTRDIEPCEYSESPEVIQAVTRRGSEGDGEILGMTLRIICVREFFVLHLLLIGFPHLIILPRTKRKHIRER